MWLQNLKADLVEGFGHSPELADGVVGEAATLASVVKVETGSRLVLAKVGWGPEPIGLEVRWRI